MERKEFEKEAERIRPKMMGTAMRLLKNEEDAKDTVQDALLKLWSMRERLEEYDSVEALSVTMVRNLCISQLRGNRNLAEPIDERFDMTDNVETDSGLLDKEEDEIAKRLIRTLPEGQQTILRMKHVEGMEVSEIVRLTGGSEDSVRSSLSRARKKIFEQFKKEYENEGN